MVLSQYAQFHWIVSFEEGKQERANGFAFVIYFTMRNVSKTKLQTWGFFLRSHLQSAFNGIVFIYFPCLSAATKTIMVNRRVMIFLHLHFILIAVRRQDRHGRLADFVSPAKCRCTKTTIWHAIVWGRVFLLLIFLFDGNEERKRGDGCEHLDRVKWPRSHRTTIF